MSEFDDKIAAMEKKLQAGNRRVFRERVCSLARQAGVVESSVDDVGDALLAHATFDDDGQGSVAGQAVDASVATYLTSRPHLRGAQQADAGGSAGKAPAGVWDPNRVTEGEYGASWQKADPESYAAAFAAHRAKVLNQQRSDTAVRMSYSPADHGPVRQIIS